LLGVSQQEELLGKTDFDFFPTARAKMWFAQEQSIMQTGEPMLQEEEFQPWRSRQRRWLLTSKIPLRDENGEVIGLVGRDTDISEQIRIAERERAIARNLQGGVEAADELIAIRELDTFYRRAVELGREKLNLERCAIFLIAPDGESIIGTYGTDA